MAAIPDALDAEREAAGRQILALLDEVGLEIYAAGWAFSRDTGSWRYIVSTPLLMAKGPSWIYERLLKVFRVHRLPEGVTPLDIFVIDPELEMQTLGNLMGMKNNLPGDLPTMIVKDADFGPFAIPYGFVALYRRLLGEDRRQGNPMRFSARARAMSEAPRP